MPFVALYKCLLRRHRHQRGLGMRLRGLGTRLRGLGMRLCGLGMRLRGLGMRLIQVRMIVQVVSCFCVVFQCSVQHWLSEYGCEYIWKVRRSSGGSSQQCSHIPRAAGDQETGVLIRDVGGLGGGGER